MRSLRSRILLAVLAATIFSSSAWATPVVRITWDECGGCSLISAAPASSLTARISIEAGEEGVSSYGVSVQFDDDLVLASTNPSDLGLYPEEFLPPAFSFSLSPGVEGVGTGTVLTFEAATFGAGAANTSFDIGIIHFVVASPKIDGIDVGGGLFNVGIDGLFDTNGGDLAGAAGYQGASVIPEPGTIALLLPGIAGLIAGRRRRA